MKNKRIVPLAICLLFLISSLSFGTISGDLLTGELLTGADEGWKKFDDNNPNIVYTNYTAQVLPDNIAYRGIHHYSNIGNATIKFRFTGSKLKLNASLTANAQKYIVNIDGDTTSITPNATGYTFLINTFAKTDLSEGVHTVLIESTCVGEQITLDSISIAANGELIGLNQPFNLTAVGKSKTVELSWDAVKDSTSYIIKRSTSENGPFINVGTATTNSFTDNSVTTAATYYYTVSAVVSNIESQPSNVASVTIENLPISSNAAILEITLKSGIIKEYNLSASEITAFLEWFDSRSDGAGKSYCVLPINSKIKPFVSRNEYILFDKIQSFKVSEYID